MIRKLWEGKDPITRENERADIALVLSRYLLCWLLILRDSEKLSVVGRFDRAVVFVIIEGDGGLLLLLEPSLVEDRIGVEHADFHCLGTGDNICDVVEPGLQDLVSKLDRCQVDAVDVHL